MVLQLRKNAAKEGFTDPEGKLAAASKSLSKRNDKGDEVAKVKTESENTVKGSKRKATPDPDPAQKRKTRSKK